MNRKERAWRKRALRRARNRGVIKSASVKGLTFNQLVDIFRVAEDDDPGGDVAVSVQPIEVFCLFDEDEDGLCEATTKRGKPCRNKAQSKGLCHIHRSTK